MSSSSLPFTIPPKARAAPAITMDVSASKCNNTCRKENCTVHTSKPDLKGLSEIMGRMSLSDLSNSKTQSTAASVPAPVVAIPRSLSNFLVRKPKVRFHFVRHAQALNNMRNIINSTTLRDTNLTPHGREQARALQTSFPHAKSVKYILSSPLRRTINTALLGFPSVYARGVKVVLWEDLREFGNSQCNTGSTLHKLRENIRDINTGVVNTELLYGGWEWLHERGDAAKRERVEKVRRELKQFEQVVLQGGLWKGMAFLPHYGDEDLGVVVVSHGGILSKLMGYPRQNWANAEWRTFKYPSISKVTEDGHHPLDLIETKASFVKTHIPIKETGPPFHMVIDDTTYDRLIEIREFSEHVESMDRKAREGQARAFGEFLKGVGADEDKRD